MMLVLVGQLSTHTDVLLDHLPTNFTVSFAAIIIVGETNPLLYMKQN